jgi:hypothetical protein
MVLKMSLSSFEMLKKNEKSNTNLIFLSFELLELVKLLIG